MVGLEEVAVVGEEDGRGGDAGRRDVGVFHMAALVRMEVWVGTGVSLITYTSGNECRPVEKSSLAELEERASSKAFPKRLGGAAASPARSPSAAAASSSGVRKPLFASPGKPLRTGRSSSPRSSRSKSDLEAAPAERQPEVESVKFTAVREGRLPPPRLCLYFLLLNLGSIMLRSRASRYTRHSVSKTGLRKVH